MDFNITVKRKFTVNGKEYKSIEEMPVDVREKFKKVMGTLANSEHPAAPSLLQKNISFHAALGTDEMDAEPPAIGLEKLEGDVQRELGIFGKGRPPLVPQATKFEASFSGRILIVCFTVGALLYLLYYLWHING